jgi:hypothetical protein
MSFSQVIIVVNLSVFVFGVNFIEYMSNKSELVLLYYWLINYSERHYFFCSLSNWEPLSSVLDQCPAFPCRDLIIWNNLFLNIWFLRSDTVLYPWFYFHYYTVFSKLSFECMITTLLILKICKSATSNLIICLLFCLGCILQGICLIFVCPKLDWAI